MDRSHEGSSDGEMSTNRRVDKWRDDGWARPSVPKRLLRAVTSRGVTYSFEDRPPFRRDVSFVTFDQHVHEALSPLGMDPLPTFGARPPARG